MEIPIKLIVEFFYMI